MIGPFCRAEGSDAGGQCDQARQAEVALTILLTALVQPGYVFGGVCGGSCHSIGIRPQPQQTKSVCLTCVAAMQESQATNDTYAM